MFFGIDWCFTSEDVEGEKIRSLTKLIDEDGEKTEFGFSNMTRVLRKLGVETGELDDLDAVKDECKRIAKENPECNVTVKVTVAENGNKYQNINVGGMVGDEEEEE